MLIVVMKVGYLIDKAKIKSYNVVVRFMTISVMFTVLNNKLEKQESI